MNASKHETKGRPMTTTSTAIVVTGSASGALATIAGELEGARAFASASRAPRTRDAYRLQFGTFAAWCSARGLEALPALPVIRAFRGYRESKVFPATMALLAHRAFKAFKAFKANQGAAAVHWMRGP